MARIHMWYPTPSDRIAGLYGGDSVTGIRIAMSSRRDAHFPTKRSHGDARNEPLTAPGACGTRPADSSVSLLSAAATGSWVAACGRSRLRRLRRDEAETRLFFRSITHVLRCVERENRYIIRDASSEFLHRLAQGGARIVVDEFDADLRGADQPRGQPYLPLDEGFMVCNRPLSGGTSIHHDCIVEVAPLGWGEGVCFD